jgi:hypothetical protein
VVARRPTWKGTSCIRAASRLGSSSADGVANAVSLKTSRSPRLRAPARVQHHAPDAVDAEPGCQRRAAAPFTFTSARAGPRCRGDRRYLFAASGLDPTSGLCLRRLVLYRFRIPTCNLESMAPDVVRERVRHRIEDGRLPRDRTIELWHTRGFGQICHGCGLPITAAEWMCLICADDWRTIRLHDDCHAFWVDERTRH